MSLTPVPRRLLRDEAYEALRAAIVRGELAPGQVIRDADLAAQVGLSRTPVREALARLAADGLVVSRPNSFTRVTPLDRRDCQEAFTVLCCLHELAATQAATCFGPRELARMRAANARFEAAVGGGDVEAALAADDEVHAVVVDAAANRTLAAMLERLTPRVRRLERLRFGSLPGRESVQVHERIAVALGAGDAAAAATLTRENWSTLGRVIDAAFGSDDPADPQPRDGADQPDRDQPRP